MLYLPHSLAATRVIARIASLVAERFGAETRYECEYVARIPQEPSGKYRFCISKVPNLLMTSTPTEVVSSLAQPLW